MEFALGVIVGAVAVGYAWPAFKAWQFRRENDGMTDEDFRQ
jgi:hypothetical protein